MSYVSKKLVIFGAGASFGSEKGNVPPLSDSLFNKLVESNPYSWGKIDLEMASVFQNNFERGMKKLVEEYPHILVKAQKSMADFFAKFLPTNKNLYVKLALRIKDRRWTGSIATLNYDRLLQLSLMELGLKQKFDHGIFPEVQVCYPHGCCNFFCEGITATNGVSINGNAIIFGGNGQISFGNGGVINFGSDGITTRGNSIKIVNGYLDISSELNTAFPPVMSYFIPSKFTTSCENFIENERNRFSILVANANDIVIIGTKIRNEDKHIWNPISQTSARITYCAGNDGRKYFKWAKTNRLHYQDDSVLNGYWDENFDEICSILEL